MSNNIVTISSGTPLDFRAMGAKQRANSAKNVVTEVGGRMQALDQLDGVDLSSKPGSVDVSNAKLPGGGLLSSLVPEKVTGFAEFADDGNLTSLYTSSQDLKGSKELNYQRNADGSQVYAVVIPTGQTTVRENSDGTLFLLESPQPNGADLIALSSPDFKAPELAPGSQPRTVEEASTAYAGDVKRRGGLLQSVLSGDEATRNDSLKSLGDEVFGNLGLGSWWKKHS